MYDKTGASTEPVCLPPDPEFGRTSGGDSGRMYSAEFDENFFHPNGAGQDVPCAVYRVKLASSVIMIPGKSTCNSGGGVDHDGKLFYPVIAKCGSLQCPPYKNNYPLTCVICSK